MYKSMMYKDKVIGTHISYRISFNVSLMKIKTRKASYGNRGLKMRCIIGN